MTVMAYHIGKQGADSTSSVQAQKIREIIFAEAEASVVLSNIVAELSDNKYIDSDTVVLVNRAVMAHYGAEYQGLGGDDYALKTDFYRRVIILFPDELGFQFELAECLNLAGESIDALAAVFLPAFRRDTSNKYSVSAEIFEALTDSKYADELNELLDQKYD